MIVGTAGHIDHGKTSLVRALTGVDTDRLKEEKARGISIDLGFAYLPIGERVVGFVDVPGHERFVHTMLAGAGGIDYVAIVDLLGIDSGLVALTLADLVDDDRLAAVEAEIRGTLAGSGLADADILPVSTVSGAGVADIRERLGEAAARFAGRTAGGRFRLAVDRSFTLPGAGTVVTGTVLSGRVSVGDQVTISPRGLAARVRSIRAQDRPAAEGKAGDRCGLNLAGEGIGKDKVGRGDMVLDPELHAPATQIDASLRVLPGERRPIGQWFPVRLHHAAAEVGARIVLLDDAPIAPGGEAVVQLALDAPIAAAAGDRFVVGDTSAQRTIGGGRFLDLRGPSRRSRSPERRAQLAAHALADPEAAVAALAATAPFFVDLGTFARDRALGTAEIGEIAGRLGLVRLAVGRTTIALSAEAWERFEAELLARLALFHAENPDLPGLGFERLRLQLEPRLPAPVFAAALQSFARAGEVGLDGAWVRLPSHEVRLTPNDEALWFLVSRVIGGDARFRPPRVRDIAHVFNVPEPEVRRILKLIGRIGRADEVAHDHFFLRGTVAEMVEILQDLSATAPDGQFTAAQFRDRIDSGRKVAIQILEFFDRHGVTLRRGDLRKLNRHRLDLFRRSGGEEPKAIEKQDLGRDASPVGRPDFKSGRGREPVLGGFDSHSLPPR